MAHYAFLDSNNIVTEVIVGKNEGENDIDWEQHYGEFRGQVCKRTSYNTAGGVHSLGGDAYRKNYAGIGYTWDGTGFAPPQPFASWTKDDATYQWSAPTPMPVVEGKRFNWDEPTLSWVEVTQGA